MYILYDPINRLYSIRGQIHYFQQTTIPGLHPFHFVQADPIDPPVPPTPPTPPAPPVPPARR